MSTETILTTHISEEIAIGKSRAIMPDDDLLSTGIIDSLAVLQLVMYVEEQFSIVVPDEAVIYENFHSISALAEYIDRRKLDRA